MQTNESARDELFLYLCFERFLLAGGQPAAQKKNE
jgi:hypothetical protein